MLTLIGIALSNFYIADLSVSTGIVLKKTPQFLSNALPHQEGLSDPTSGGEGNKQFLRRVWKPLLNRLVLKL